MRSIKYLRRKPNKILDPRWIKKYSAPVFQTVIPDWVSTTLEDNPWPLIKQICEAGDAANYWAVGDVKQVTGGDGKTRNVAIVDMSGMYGKNVVFQFRDLTEVTYVWNASNSNAYATCEITPKLASEGDAFVELMDSVLGDLLTDTSFKVATSGQDSTLVTNTQKLFLPAEKEITGTRHYSAQDEFDALSTFAFYTGAGDTNANRILKSVGDQTARSWWERSPYAGNATNVCVVFDYGGLFGYNATNSYRLAPCFAF